MQKSLIIFLVSTVLWVNSAIAEKQQPPVGGEAKDFVLTQTSSIELDNGLRVVFVPYGNTPKVTLRLVSKLGNYDDGEFDGIADLAYQLLTEGTKSQSALDIAQRAADMGGQVNTSVGSNSSYLQMDVLGEFVGDAADLLGDLVLNSNFKIEDLDRARNNFLRDLSVQRSEAQGQAAEAFNLAVFGKHPYAVTFADDNKVKAITAKAVAVFVQQNLVAKRSVLYVSGKFDQAKAEHAIRLAFANLVAGVERVIPTPDYQGAGKLIFVSRDNAPQSTIYFGLPVVDPSNPDYIALELMNTLLGGSFASRITSNIREDKGYTYSPRSIVSTRINSALWYQTADVTAESTAAALQEIINEITRLQNEAPSSDELEGFKSYMSGIYVLQNSTRTAIINQLWFLESHGLPLSRLESYVQQINSISPEQISALAKKYLSLDNMTLVVVGDAASVKPQLAANKQISTLYQ
jgi:zinc protease